VTHSGTIPYIVAHSDLVAIVPRRLALKFAGIVDIMEVESKIGDVDFTLSMAWPPHLNSDQAHRLLRELIRQCSIDLLRKDAA